MNAETREQALKRIRRAAGQVAAIERMIRDDRYCVDVLLQVAAARAALDGLGKQLLQAHVGSCVSEAIATGRPKERAKKVAELMEVFARFSEIGGR
jgi:DNA-binding FrmR family transcriptional regulator